MSRRPLSGSAERASIRTRWPRRRARLEARLAQEESRGALLDHRHGRVDAPQRKREPEAVRQSHEERQIERLVTAIALVENEAREVNDGAVPRLIEEKEPHDAEHARRQNLVRHSVEEEKRRQQRREAIADV